MRLDSTEMSIDRLSGSGCAIVRGLDISRPQAPEQIETLKQLLDEHLVIALPDQEIDLDRLEQFTDEFGGRSVTPYVTPVDGRPNVIRVIKEPTDELNFANNWHTDLSYLPAPPAYTILHARVVPEYGGDTLWANQYQAYESLPASVRDRIRGLMATHSAGMAYGTGGYLDSVSEQSSMGIEPSQDAFESHNHPMVIRHPRTGRPALFVNSSYSTGIEGMDDNEGRELLNRLMMHATNPNLTCRLRWKPNMLTIWDNASTQHLAINDYPGQRREMFRTSVKGTAYTAC